MTLFLIIAAITAAYTASLFLWPFRPCSRCLGTGRNAGSNRKRHGDCARCHGAGRRQRIGSRFVHRTVLSIRSERARERQRRKGTGQ